MSVTAGEEYLSVRRPAQDNGSLTGSLQYSADDDLGRFYNGAPRVLPENAPQSERPSLSLEEAGALCGEVFRAMGVSDVQLAQAYVTGSPGDYAYILYYVRTVAGVPAPSVRSPLPAVSPAFPCPGIMSRSGFLSRMAALRK